MPFGIVLSTRGGIGLLVNDRPLAARFIFAAWMMFAGLGTPIKKQPGRAVQAIEHRLGSNG